MQQVKGKQDYERHQKMSGISVGMVYKHPIKRYNLPTILYVADTQSIIVGMRSTISISKVQFLVIFFPKKFQISHTHKKNQKSNCLQK